MRRGDAGIALRKNKFGEQVMVALHGGNGPYYVCRDPYGKSVLRHKEPDGKELFADKLDDGSRNKDKERVFNVNLLYAVVEKKGGLPAHGNP